jgi:tripartite-type tricarboxylate transporter receptor subunit TctC
MAARPSDDSAAKGGIRMLTRRATLLATLAATAALVAGIAPSVHAQTFTKQVTIIVPFAPGGTSDILARLIGPKLSESIGQPVIVENKPGASGNLGADFVAKAAPDGHTLLLTDVGSLATAPTLFRKLSFDVQKDLVPVTMVLFAPYLFAVHPSVPANTVAELAAYAKANPGKLNVGNSGVGAANHLTSIVVGKHLGIDWGYVPYRGGAAAIRAVVSNESNVIFNGATATQPFVVQGQLKGLAVSGDTRMTALPNLPSFKELNLPAVDSGTWQGIHTSKGTPPAMVSRLNAEFRKVLAMPDIAAKIGELGGEVKAGAPEDMSKWMAQAIIDWGKVVQDADIKLD